VVILQKKISYSLLFNSIKFYPYYKGGKFMLKLLTRLVLLSVGFCACIYWNKSSAQEQQLFNHQNLDGWKMVGEGKFLVQDNLLVSEGGMGLLYYTKQKFGNAKIHIVYKVSYSDTNSGIFVRIAHAPKDAWDAVHHGYEIQICDAGKDAFDDYHKTGAIYTFAKISQLATRKIGEWNDLTILLKGKTIQVILNGIKVSKYTTGDPAPKRGRFSDPKRGPRPIYGYIGVQNHDQGATHSDSHVYFKEISVSPL
jgi:hypothetical protein